MIKEENLKDLLKALNFTEKKNILSKHFADNEAYLKVDFNKKVLIYPTDKGFKVNGEFTCNFSSPENFVVFECVNRLFEKGYKPEHIELEPKWKVGHGASGGRADILVKDNSSKALLIIECKTEGTEFKKEWNNTLQHGGQLMSYVQNAGSTKYICLYASDFADGKVIPNYYVLSVHDNEKLLEELKDKKPLSFAAAKALEVEDIYKAWKETYSLDFATKGIFEDDIQAYQIGKQKYTVEDLSEVGSKDIQSKYHEFATIMRQHNVSGRENAFDKLVNLFLCKIVDEAKNAKDLKFYWKGIAYDSYFDLQDRLQLLYQSGMKEFLGEDVTYIDNAAIDKAFRFFKKDPDATRETIKKYFRQLKFFTNNDFAFIDVHNEKLFYQNSAVLLKIVQMLQDTRLQSENQNQFLGDMFEGFLDQGVKQSEGQFFTPMPIVKFILNSLPIESIIKESELPPKAVDYACGAGHFLNELALQIKPFVKQHKETDIKEYYKEIVGVEKEYRLSKVAKVSAFMYGQDDIKITYADALGKKAKLQENEYSILVANPPYSVKGFLQTLTEKERKSFELINTVDEKSFANNNSIETFFIERAKQLLKTNGVAGIILPTSILSNDSNIYCTAREILIKYFDIVSIVEFGSQTFGKTGTNTVTLFLRRKEENPSPAEHWQNRVNSWFADNEADAVYNDSNYISNYCNHIGVEVTQYKTLLSGKPSEDLVANEMFADYKKAFDNSTEIKNLKKLNSAFGKKPKAEQETELQKRLTEYLQAKEKDKLYFYVLASENKQKVLVLRYGSKTKEQRKFLGYSWSSAKGKEGIKYLNTSTRNISEEDDVVDSTIAFDDKEEQRILKNLNSISNINTPLYNDNFFTKFDNNGVMLWATDFGSTSGEANAGVAVDALNNVYFIGETTTSFPLYTLAGGYNQAFITGSGTGVPYEGTITCFGSSNATPPKWSTYFSSNYVSQPIGIATYRASKLYVVGSTQDVSGFPLVNMGGGAWYKDTLNGYIGSTSWNYADGFVARFDLSPIANGIEENKVIVNDEMLVYPNPNNGDVTLQLNLKETTDVKITVYSVLGQKVFEEQLKNKTGVVKENINLSEIKNGMYFISVSTSDKLMSAKIIKQ